MVSNPVRFFVTGNKTRSFEYEGGDKLFHFSPRDDGLSENSGCNVVFFANDEKHALDVLRRMFKFAIDCANEGIDNCDMRMPYAASFEDRRIKQIAMYARWLDCLDADRILVTLAPTNQFFKVGWASNDTI